MLPVIFVVNVMSNIFKILHMRLNNEPSQKSKIWMFRVDRENTAILRTCENQTSLQYYELRCLKPIGQQSLFPKVHD